MAVRHVVHFASRRSAAFSTQVDSMGSQQSFELLTGLVEPEIQPE